MDRKILLIALAGTVGTLARYWLSGAVYKVFGADLPWGTWAVNILGCFLFGLVWVLAEERYLISGEARIVILVGFMGAFTTFSTYIFESSQLVFDAQWARLAANLAGQNIVGFAGLALGMTLGRVL
jgi:CrcB protein